jgi:hypothetical protein
VAYAGIRATKASSFGTRIAGRHSRAGRPRVVPGRSPALTAATGSKAPSRPGSRRPSASARQASSSAAGGASGWPPSGAEPVAAATATYACSPWAGSATASASPARALMTTGSHRRMPAQEAGRETATEAERTPRPKRLQDGSGRVPRRGAGTIKAVKVGAHEMTRTGRRVARPTIPACATSRNGASERGATPRRWFASAMPPSLDRTG